VDQRSRKSSFRAKILRLKDHPAWQALTVVLAAVGIAVMILWGKPLEIEIYRLPGQAPPTTHGCLEYPTNIAADPGDVVAVDVKVLGGKCTEEDLRALPQSPVGVSGPTDSTPTQKDVTAGGDLRLDLVSQYSEGNWSGLRRVITRLRAARVGPRSA
jgi:hypothetical protein